MEQDIKNCINTLENGGVILYPTDTVWGLGCDATNEEAVKKIFTIKQRAESKSLIVLLPEPIDILQYVASPPINILEMLEAHNKPTTIIYPQALAIASNAIAADGSVAIRICSEKFCYALLKRFRKPIISTSANISGNATPAIFIEIEPEILNAVDYTVNYRQNDETRTAPSTILLIDDDENFTVIRD
jgi:L-threonylcarbamoyladenylate synthase